MTMEQLLLNKLDQIGVDFIGIFIDLFSGKVFVSIEIFLDLFSLGIFLLCDFQREQFPPPLELL